MIGFMGPGVPKSRKPPKKFEFFGKLGNFGYFGEKLEIFE
jgi:hypothetical protein